MIVKVKVALPVWLLLLVAPSVTVYGLPASVPAAGVPEIDAVVGPVALTLKPAGNGAAPQLVIG